MIIDIDLFNSTSFGSAKRILCRCDECGLERLVIKQNLVKAKNHDCNSCSSRKAGKARIGLPLGDEHRRKTGLASKGRVYSDEVKAKLRARARRGPENNRWNPDRDVVLRNEKARYSSYSLLWGTLRRIKSKKLSSTTELLGYNALELAAHIEARFLSGMSWENRKEWHIDHIKPVSVFIAEGIEDVRVINALSNLRPLWAHDNLVKRASWTPDPNMSGTR